MISKYKIKKFYREAKYKLKKQINKIRINKAFYFSATMIFVMIFVFLLSKPYKAPFIAVEIKNVDNYAFQVTSEGLNKTIPFQKVRFKLGDDKNILHNDLLYIYRRSYAPIPNQGGFI